MSFDLLRDQPSGADFGASLAPHRIYIDTFGCQMNQHDSLRMIGLMAAEGYVPTDTPEDADLIVINSCSVRGKAEHKLRSIAGSYKKIKRRRPDVILALSGCVAQQEGEALLHQVEHADIVFGPDHVARLPEIVQRVRDARAKKAADARLNQTTFVDRKDYNFPPLTDAAPMQASAFVSVMKGCDKFCTFCIVPFTRGREVSRPAQEIVAEVEQLAARGTREVILLGQTVNCYGRLKREGHLPFHELLAEVAAVEGIARVRFTSPHPADVTEGQVEAFRDIPELCPHIHLPVQSGSTKVLELMGRGHTREDYLSILSRLRAAVPEVAVTSDFIVGFPGETKEDFRETLSLIEQVRFAASFSFSYSERTGTRALEIEPTVPPMERLERLYQLQALQNEITQEILNTKVGQRHTVMIEGPSKTDAERSSGRNGQNCPIHVDGDFEAGRMLEVKVIEAYKHSLLAVPTQDQAS